MMTVIPKQAKQREDASTPHHKLPQLASIDLGENPSGRGAYVTEVVEGGVAATRKTIEEGDFLVALSYSGGATD